MTYCSSSALVLAPPIQSFASASRYGCGMRAVFSAMWRSLASAVIALASPRRGARSTSRAVSRTGIQLSRGVPELMVSNPVIVRLRASKWARNEPVKKLEGEPASRLPLMEPDGPRRFDLDAGGPLYGVPGLFGR